MRRLALALLALLALQGLVSLTGQRSLLREASARLRHFLNVDAAGRPVAEADRASGDEHGPYAVHPDARVGHVLRANAMLALEDSRFRSDALGLRARPGPPAVPEALRVLVLGGAAVFGCALDDADTLAVQLQSLLSRAPTATAPGAAVACRTVAMPGWNERNATAFLLDHLDTLDPQLVVYVTDADDLCDTEGANEVGDRCWLPDPASTDHWLPLIRTRSDGFVRQAEKVLAERGEPQLAGAPALLADMTRESQRRYDENAALLVELARYLQSRGVPLLVAHGEVGPYALNLGLRVRALCREQPHVELPQVDLFSHVPRELTAGSDAHPGAQATGAMAHWIAAECLQRGWVPGLPREAAASLSATLLAEVPPSLARLRAAPRSDQEQLAAAAEARAAMSRRLLPEIDVQTLAGVAQIMGGVETDGSVGTHALFVLARRGSQVFLRLEPLSERPDLYPLRVDVEVDGRPVGDVLITADSPAEGQLALPTDDAGRAIEVLLIPERSGVLRSAGAERLAAFRVLRLACVAE